MEAEDLIIIWVTSSKFVIQKSISSWILYKSSKLIYIRLSMDFHQIGNSVLGASMYVKILFVKS